MDGVTYERNRAEPSGRLVAQEPGAITFLALQLRHREPDKLHAHHRRQGHGLAGPGGDDGRPHVSAVVRGYRAVPGIPLSRPDVPLPHGQVGEEAGRRTPSPSLPFRTPSDITAAGYLPPEQVRIQQALTNLRRQRSEVTPHANAREVTAPVRRGQLGIRLRGRSSRRRISVTRRPARYSRVACWVGASNTCCVSPYSTIFPRYMKMVKSDTR